MQFDCSSHGYSKDAAGFKHEFLFKSFGKKAIKVQEMYRYHYVFSKIRELFSKIPQQCGHTLQPCKCSCKMLSSDHTLTAALMSAKSGKAQKMTKIITAKCQYVVFVRADQLGLTVSEQ